MANPRQEDQGFYDIDLVLADAQAVPVDGAADNSEHCVDFSLVAPVLEAGKPIKIKVKITTLFVVSAGTPLLDVGIITDDVEPSTGTWDGAVVVASGVLRLSGAEAKGEIFEGYLPCRSGIAWNRYVGCVLTPSTSGFSAGAVDIWLDFD